MEIAQVCAANNRKQISYNGSLQVCRDSHILMMSFWEQTVQKTNMKHTFRRVAKMAAPADALERRGG